MKKKIISVICAAAAAVQIFTTAALAADYPRRYSSVEKGYTGAMTDQKSTDICWTFVQNELLTANLAKKYGTKYDFSEQTMKFDTSNITNPLYGYMRYPNDAGSEYFSIAYLARGGSVLESDEPFSESDERSVDASALNRVGRLVSAPIAEYGPNTTNQLRSDAINKIKQLVTEYGAAGASLYYEQNAAFEYYYQNREKTNYYYHGAINAPNHAVTIVGWDDDYSKNNFASAPAYDGAFIVKNSWGAYHDSQTGDLVYVSYCDKYITSSVFATDYEMDNTLYDNIYQYDPLGWTHSVSIGAKSVFGVSRFTADRSHETVTAVSTYITEPGMTVKIYVNAQDGVSDAASYRYVGSMTCEDTGYYVIPVDPVVISGNRYSVAVEYISTNSVTSLPLQAQARRLVDNSVNIPNTCYIGTSLDGLSSLEGWCDIINSAAANSDARIDSPMLCIKAFTKKSTDAGYSNISGFSDIESSRWYAGAVDYVKGAGVFSGVESDKFAPQDNMTRAMFVKVLANLVGADLNSYDGVTAFDDVNPNSWYATAVDWALDSGIVTGVSDSEFAPTTNVSRQQMCVMIIRFAESLNMHFKQTKEPQIFADDSLIQTYARQAVYICREYGIISGVSPTEFNPRGYATRAQVATLFMNFCQKYIY